VAAFLARRLILGAVVLLLLSYGTYWFFTVNFYGPQYGRSVPKEWWTWLSGVPTGRSFYTSLPGFGIPPFVPALQHTAILLGASLVLVVVFALALGVVAAATAGSAVDVCLRIVFYASWALPAFLLALILQQVFQWAGRSLGIHPFDLVGWAGYCPPKPGSSFYTGPCPTGSGIHHLTNVLRHVTLPAVALAGSFIGLHARYLRSSLLVALEMPYTTTARAKGLPERTVLLRHALRNSLVTFTSALLLDFGSIFGAALAVDWVFKLGGLGTLFLQLIASPQIDPNQVTSVLFASAVLVVLSSLVNDVAVSLLDPRVVVR
jgi:peptide/nickel transport system permease protein